MAFKDRFRLLRDSRHLSQDELARQLGVSKSAISMYENGNREPKDLETLEKIADFFNVDMNYLLDKNDRSTYYLNPETAQLAQEIHDNPDLRILMDASRKLSPDDIKFVVDLVSRIFLSTHPCGLRLSSI